MKKRLYQFFKPDGSIISRHLTPQQFVKLLDDDSGKFRVDGELCDRVPVSGGTSKQVARAWERELWPESLAVNPEDVPARQAVDERKKLRTLGYNADGIPGFSCRRDYEAYYESEGLHQRGKNYRNRKTLGKVIIY